jgi:arylsulfatase A-like enzyme
MQMNERILPWIEAHRERPFFLYLHYIDPHIPYSPPGEFRRRFARDHGFPLANDRKEKVGIDLYDGEIRYTDDGIAELVGTLQRLGLWDRTLFFLTSDHGEEFYEHEVLGHGFSLYQPVLHVPLIARGPGIPAGRVVPEPVQIVDLAATVLDLAQTGNRRLGDGSSFAAALLDEGWREPGQYYLENEFGQDDGDQRAFVFNGVRSGPWKLVLTEQNAFFPPQRYGGEALYNLDEDPGETKNLIHEEGHREIVERMLEGLRKHATFLAERGFRDHAPTVMTPEIEANLRALGN